MCEILFFRQQARLALEAGHTQVLDEAELLGRDGPAIGGGGTGAAAGALLGTIVEGEVLGRHVDGGEEAAREQAAPLLLADVIAVVAAGQRLSNPLLLEECLALAVDIAAVRLADHVEEVVLVPCRACPGLRGVVSL